MNITSMIRKKNIEQKYIIILFLLSLTPLIWFQGNLLIDRGDLNLIYNPSIFFKMVFHTWNPLVNGGQWGFQSTALPFGLFWLVLKWLHVSLLNGEKIYFISIIFTSSFGMYYLVKTIFADQNKKLLAGFVAGIFYSFNFYVMTLTPLTAVYALMIITLPFFLLFLIKGLNSENNWKYTILISLTTLIASAAFYNFPIIIILLGLYLLFYLLFYRARLRTVIFTTKTLIMTVLVNLFWVLPVGWFIFSNQSGEIPTVLDMQSTVFHDSTYTSFLNVFRNMGFWGYSATFNNIPYFNYFHHYVTNPLLIIASFLPPLLAITYLFFGRRHKIVLFFGFFLLLVLLLNCGINGMFKDIYLWLYLNVPGFITFRDPNKFAILVVFVYAIFIGGIMAIIYDKFFDRLKNSRVKNKAVLLTRLLVGALIIFLFIPVWPMFNGEVVQPERGDPSSESYLPAERNLLPTYWWQMADNLNSKTLDFKAVSLPVSKNVYFWINWGRHGSDFVINLIEKPVLKISSGTYLKQNNYQSVTENLYDFTKDTEIKNKIIGLLNGRYLLQRNDIVTKFLEKPPGYVREDLAKINNIYYEKTFGQLDLYRLENIYFLPHFYIPKVLIITNQTINNLPQIISRSDYQIRSAIFFKKQNEVEKPQDESRKSQSKFEIGILKRMESTWGVKDFPILEFKKINPTKYRIRIHGASDDFPLVFSESFHEGWKAYLSSNVQKFEGLKVNTNDYKILEGNEEDQASREELAEFIERGWISTLGDLKEKEIKHKRYENGKENLDHIEKYKIDFISKNFQDTIQNDNLPGGRFWETWLGGKLKSSKVESMPRTETKFLVQGDKVDKIKGVFALNKNVEQLPEEDHLVANGYANSWFVDPAEVCKTKGFCHKNPDGSYDFEMVVEFWPQRLFYLGLFISGMTLLSCFGYLGYDWRRRRRRKLKVKSL